jgi:hypothetical protein
LDADDSWHPSKIEYQYRWMQNNPSIVLSGHRLSVSLNNDFTAISSNTKTSAKRIGKFQFLLKNQLSTPTVMLKKDIRPRFDERQRYAEDYLLWLEVLFEYDKVYFIEKELAYIHKAAYGEDGLSSHLWEMEKGELLAYTKIYNSGHIHYLTYTFLRSFSLVKYFKRVISALCKQNV